ncbi:MAG: nucleotidyltransferase family protein [Alphaproteobacteria bacterium]
MNSTCDITLAATAVVLAGGRGTRISALYPDLPKPMIEAAGQPFLHWVISWLTSQGLRDIILSVGYLGERIEAWARERENPAGVRIRTVREGAPLGTGGAAVNCLALAGDPVLILNGDSLVVTPLRPLFDCLTDPSCGGTLLALPVTDASRFGSLDVGPDNILRGFREKQAGSGLINGGVYLFRRETLNEFEPGKAYSMEYDVLPGLLRHGAQIRVVEADAPFLDIGTPETVVLASRFIEANLKLLIRN